MKIRNIFGYFLILLFVSLMVLPKFILTKFGEMNLEQLIFILLGNNAGANYEVVWDYIRFLAPYLLIMPLVVVIVIILTRYVYYLKICIFGFKYEKNFKLRINWIFSLSLISVGMFLLYYQYDKEFKVSAYVSSRINRSTIYEEHYVDPYSVNIEFPEKKKNLIYIILESMNTNFQSMNLSSDKQNENLIPGLINLVKSNASVSHNEELGGLYVSYGTNWTAGSLIGQSASIPLTGPLSSGNAYGQNGVFLPGVTTIGEVLELNGYNNYFAIGSEASFAGRDVFYTTHGNYEILDLHYWKNIGKIPEDYHVFWGMEDSKLFEYSKEKLIEISKEEAPFNYTMLTVDSHFTDGFTDDRCDIDYDIPYANAISCSDKLLLEFLYWISNQDFYEDTSIVLVADHSTMNVDFLEKSNISNRTLYNAFINLDFEVDNSKLINRSATVLDMFPTTLSALNVDIENDRLGLGTDLFSNRKTLPEEFGYEEFNEELSKKSLYYEKNFFKKRDK